jgi:hypothetical protein
MGIDFRDATIRAGIFVYRVMPMVAATVMDFFVEETDAATPIKFVP